MSTWLFDLGNTRLKFAQRLDGGRLGEVVAVAHHGRGLPDGWDAALPCRFEVAHVASVASPVLRVALLEVLASRCARITRATTQARLGDVRVAYAQPGQLGIDRFLALLAAHARGQARSGGAALVVGAGTALTVDLIDADGLHRGGRIAPSPRLMREALHHRVPQLPASGGDAPDFATCTLDALASGCMGAASGLVADSLRAAGELLGATPGLLVHGGDAGMLAARFPGAVLAPALVLEGLERWARVEGDDPPSAVAARP